jgi:hypothetical protein
MKAGLFFVLVCITSLLPAQEEEPVVKFRRSYFAFATELIFSMGSLGDVTITPPQHGPQNTSKISTSRPSPRFSLFLHLGEQFHYNFSQSAGFYTGISLRNTGMINRLNDTIRIKQRVYSLGIPLAFKLGNMGKRIYVAAGAELELFFHFKQRSYLGTGRGRKQDQVIREWLSSRHELFNPAVFMEFNFGKGSYIRLKYYLNPFLVSSRQNYTLNNGFEYTFVPQQSQFFSLSLGRIIMAKRK